MTGALSWVICVCSLAGMALTYSRIRSLRVWGPVCGLVLQPMWAYHGYITDSPGIAVASIAYFGLHLKGLHTFTKEAR